MERVIDTYDELIGALEKETAPKQGAAKKQRKSIKKKALFYVIVGLMVGVISLFLSFFFGQKVNQQISKTRENYQGTLLSVEEGKVYKAVTVLSYSVGQGEGAVPRFFGGLDMRTAGGKPIEAGKAYTYNKNQGLALATETKDSPVKPVKLKRAVRSAK